MPTLPSAASSAGCELAAAAATCVARPRPLRRLCARGSRRRAPARSASSRARAVPVVVNAPVIVGRWPPLGRRALGSTALVPPFGLYPPERLAAEQARACLGRACRRANARAPSPRSSSRSARAAAGGRRSTRSSSSTRPRATAPPRSPRSAGARGRAGGGAAPELGPVLGKGDAMWRALSVLRRRDLVCFIDADGRGLQRPFRDRPDRPAGLRARRVQFVKGLLPPSVQQSAEMRLDGRRRPREPPDGPARRSRSSTPSSRRSASRWPAKSRRAASCSKPAVRDRLRRRDRDADRRLAGASGWSALAQVDLEEHLNSHQSLPALTPMADDGARDDRRAPAPRRAAAHRARRPRWSARRCGAWPR